MALQLRIWIIPCCSGQIVITTYNKSLGLVILDRQLRSDQLNRLKTSSLGLWYTIFNIVGGQYCSEQDINNNIIPGSHLPGHILNQPLTGGQFMRQGVDVIVWFIYGSNN